MLVELKDGDTLNGHLLSCDTWMNLVMKEVIQTSAEGDKFFRLEEAYVRGNNVRPYCPLLETPVAEAQQHYFDGTVIDTGKANISDACV